MQLRVWQREFYKSVMNRKYSLVMGARGVGKDTIILLICLSLLDSGEDIAILNKDERLNKIFIRKLSRLSKDLRAPLTGSVLELRHKLTGATITALTGKNDNLQGIHSTIIVNELGGLEGDPEEAIAFALGSVGSRDASRLIVATNSTGPGSWLHSLFDSDEARFQEYRDLFAPVNITIWDAYPDGLPDTLLRQHRSLSPALWARWYENAFVDGESYCFSDIHFQRCLARPPISATAQRVACLDVGATRDPSGLVVLGHGLGGWHLIHEERAWAMPLAAQVDWLTERRRTLGFSRCLIDAGGVGLHVWQGLQGTNWAVRGSFSASFYAGAVPAMQSMMLDGSLSVDPSSLTAFELRKLQISDKGKLHKPHIQVEGGISHCDLADALLGASSLTSQVPILTGPAQVTVGRPTSHRGLAPMRPLIR